MSMNIKENYLRAIKRQNPQWVPRAGEAVITVRPPICERPKTAGKDVFGCEWAINENAKGGTYPAERNFVITDINKWREQVTFPDVDAFDWSAAKEEAQKIDKENYLVGGFIEMGLFERIYLLMGMEEALMAYYTDEEEIEALASAIADYKIEFLKKYHEQIGINHLWYGDDWGTQSNLFISPEIWRRVIKPHTKRIYDCAKSLGIIINQHSCGKIESVVGDLVEMGADCWNPCQPCNDLCGLKKQYGDSICFIGGVDSQFVLDNDLATADDVVDEVIKRIDEMALPNGGYIIGPSHSVPYNPEKLEAMNRTIKEYGSKIYEQIH
jgi:uroporphyrinogen-III decarboxylase